MSLPTSVVMTDHEEVTMKAKVINELGEKTYAIVFNKGDEMVDGLLSFAREKKIEASHFTAIGALSDVTLGYFNWSTVSLSILLESP